MIYPISENETELTVVSKNQFDIKKFLFKLFRFLPWIFFININGFTSLEKYTCVIPQSSIA